MLKKLSKICLYSPSTSSNSMVKISLYGKSCMYNDKRTKDNVLMVPTTVCFPLYMCVYYIYILYIMHTLIVILCYDCALFSSSLALAEIIVVIIIIIIIMYFALLKYMLCPNVECSCNSSDSRILHFGLLSFWALAIISIII